MKHADSIAQRADALAKAEGKIRPEGKDSTNLEESRHLGLGSVAVCRRKEKWRAGFGAMGVI